MTTAKATVYVVDDDASVRKAVARVIQTAGLNVKTFASALEFLDQAPPDSPGCLVLDIRMPGMSGLELQAEITRAALSTCAAPKNQIPAQR